MVELKQEIPSIDEAVDYLKMRRTASPLRFNFLRERVREELRRVGLGEFTDEQAKEILEKVDQK